jgi:hypothetical protein
MHSKGAAIEWLHRNASSLTALLGALAAGVCTMLAMVGVVFLALGRANVADLGAQSADVWDELRPATHERRSCPAQGGAVPIAPNALDHLLDILFTQTSIRTVFTRLSATDTGFDTGFIILVTHNNRSCNSKLKGKLWADPLAAHQSGRSNV